MMRTTLSFLILCIGCIVALVKSDELIDLTDATFEHETQASTGGTTGSWLVLFGTDSCSPCATLKETLAELLVSDEGIVIGVVNAETSPRTAARFGIVNVPTLVYLHQGQLYRYNDGDRSVESLTDFVVTSYATNSVPEAIPEPISLLDQIKDVIEKVLDGRSGGLLRYAMLAMSCLFAGTSFLLVVALLRGGSSGKAKKS